MAKPDFSKIFAQNGAITALTDSQFLQGFGYLGDNPPTKEEFNYLLQNIDKKLEWLNSFSGDHSHTGGEDGAILEAINITNEAIGNLGTTNIQATLAALLTAINKKPVGSVGRNMLFTGPKDGSGSPTALYSDMANGNITLKAGTKLTFASGLDDNGAPKDYPINVLADVTKTLGAADQYTVPVRYTEDLCVDGTPISGGDNGGNVKANAFDSSDSTYWSSSQSSTAITGAAYLGWVFAVTKDIRRVRVLQGINDTQSITTAELQYSLDGSTNWTKAADVTLNKIAVNGSRETIITIPYIANAKGWRLMARSSCSLNWTVYTIEMMEALQTHYLYADYIDGVISLVSSKNAPQRGIFDATATYAADTYFYDVETGQSRNYDGTSWVNVTRVYVGSADVDSSGKIVAVKSEPYNLPRIRVRDAEDVNEPVALGQLLATIAISTRQGWFEIPIIDKTTKKIIPIIIQWAVKVNVGSTTSPTVTLPIACPHEVLLAIPIDYANEGGTATSGGGLSWDPDYTTNTTVQFRAVSASATPTIHILAICW